LKIPILTITLYAETTEPYIRFHPKLDKKSNEFEGNHGSINEKDKFDCTTVIIRFLTEIIAACKMMPRVEKKIFPGEI